MKILDRYIARETVAPFLLALLVFTFVLAVRPALDEAENLLAKNVPLPTVAYLLALLLPQALGVAIPMALLVGLLMALGRLSGDREAVALLACGVSPQRLFRPVLAIAVAVGLMNLYVMVWLVPDSNQQFREVTFSLLQQQSETDVKPGLFYEGFPNLVIFIRGEADDGTWQDVLVADMSHRGRPTVTYADAGTLEIDRDARLVNVWLERATRYQSGADPLVYDISESERTRLPISATAVFGDGTLAMSRGLAELDIAGLRVLAEQKAANNESPHNEIMYIHQKFSFPVACLVFGLIALPVGLHTRKEGKLAGFSLGLGIVFAYWILMAQAEDWTKGGAFPAEWARWVPNIGLGLAGLAALWWRARGSHTLSVRVPAWLLGLRPGRRPADVQAADDGRWPSRPVVVLRVPSLALPRPRLLDSYVATRYLRIIGLSFFGLLGLYYIGQFIELSEKLFKGSATGALLLSYFWYSTPQFISYIVPIAILVAVLGTIGGLTRTGELTVMRACGVSLYRAAAPLLLLALVWSGGLFLLEERVLARANRRAEVLEDIIRDRGPRTVNVANKNWLVGEDGRIYYYAVFDPATDQLYALSVFEVDTAPYRLAAHTYVTRARFEDGGWIADEGWTQRFDAGGSGRQDFTGAPLALAPLEEFERAQVDTDVMTFGEQREYVRQLRASGYSVKKQEVDLQRKLAFPLVTVVMTLLAIPFGVTTGRRGALYGIGLAIGLAVAYWLLTTVFMAAGTAGLLPAALAAWAGNVLFLTGGLYLMLTVRT